MGTRRFIIGKRSNGERGVFIGPPGIDPDTASASQLSLHISNKVDQIILQGQVSSLPASVTLGLTSYAPYVLILAFGGFQSAPVGLARPYGNFWDQRNATATVTAATMFLNGTSPHCYYLVFNRPAP